MSQQELMAFSVSNDIYMWFGIILGLFISGFFKSLLNFLAYRFERPRRIRFRNLNGRHERKDNFEYLYLFRGEYYTLEQRDFLFDERRKAIRTVARLDNKFIVTLIMLIAMIFLSLFLLVRNPLI